MTVARLAFVAAAIVLTGGSSAHAAKFVFDIQMTSQTNCSAVDCIADDSFVPYSHKLTIDFTPARRLDNTTTNFQGEMLRIVSLLGPAQGGPPDADLLALSGLNADMVGYRIFATQVDIGVPPYRGQSQAFISSNGGRVFDTEPGVVRRDGYYLSLSTLPVQQTFLPYAGLSTTNDLYVMLRGLDANGGFEVMGGASHDDYAFDPETGETLRDDSYSVARRGTARLNVAESAIPEPGTWALLILGFGAIGMALRRGRVVVA
jgi:PEP-CTERM motif